MKKCSLYFALSALILLGSCAPKNDVMNNPLLQEWTTPFQTPPFDQIELEDFKPALLYAMEQHKAEIDAIVNNPDEATFENTIVPYDRAGELLSKVYSAFGSINGADTNDEIQALAQEFTPLMSRHSSEISLNPKLFERIKAVYDKKDELELSYQAKLTLEKYYEDFVRNGANLNEEDKAKLMEINSELSTLSLKYGQNILKETNSFRLVVDNVEDLEGLPQANIQAAAAQAKSEGMEGKYVFTPSKPSWIPFLQYAKNRELREKLYKGYYMRGDNDNENDNKALVTPIINNRVKKAKLLGYNSYADYVLERNMAKTPTAVIEFLERLYAPALKRAKEELAQMQAIADKEDPGVKIESWDWWYYAEKLRKERYDLDEQEIMPYLVLDNVRDGMFYVAGKLYGLQFEELHNIPVYNPEVKTFEVKDRDGKHMAILYLDTPARPGKRAGAWCSGFRGYQKKDDGTEVMPLVSICCNFSSSVDGKPVLLTWDEAETLFHEFGHALHNFFARGDYDRICGSLPRDMVELPSQIDEHWVSQPQVMKVFAKNVETGEAMPDALIQKIINANAFNQGFMTTELVAASLLDMFYHVADTEKQYDVRAFEKEFADHYGLIPQILPRYRSTYFSHIFNGGYAVGYYVYLWAEVLDADAFDAYEQSGDIFNPEIAERFRKYILAEGGLGDPMQQYLNFRGQMPTEEPLLRNRGLL